MEELNDYTGEFRPDLKLSDFSMNFLVKMMRVWAEAYVVMDRLWFKTVTEKLGETEALSCQLQAWLKIADNTAPKFAKALNFTNLSKEYLVGVMREWSSAYLSLTENWRTLVKKKIGEVEAFNCEVAALLRIVEVNVPNVARAFDIQVNDVVDALKVWQLCVDGPMTGVYQAKYDIRSRNLIVFTVTRCGTLNFFEREAPHRIVPICHRLEPAVWGRYATVILPDMVLTPLKLPPRKSQDEVPCVWEIKATRPVPRN